MLLCVITATGLALLLLAPGDAHQRVWLDHVASAWHQVALLSLIAGSLAAAALRGRWRFLPPIVIMAVWWGQIARIPAAPALPRGTETTYRLLTLNAQGDRLNADHILAFIERLSPDVICLQEASGDKIALGEILRESYPYQLKSQPGFRWFTMLLSRYPIEPIDEAPHRVIARYEEGSLQSAVISLPSGPVLVGTVHIVRGNKHRAIWEAGNRGASLVSAHLADTATAHGVPAILAGDMNGGPFAKRGRNIRQDGRWRIAQRPYPWHGTWHSVLPAFLRVQPDQVYMLGELGVRSHSVGRSVRSDHRPIIVEFGFLR